MFYLLLFSVCILPAVTMEFRPNSKQVKCCGPHEELPVKPVLRLLGQGPETLLTLEPAKAAGNGALRGRTWRRLWLVSQLCGSACPLPGLGVPRDTIRHILTSRAAEHCRERSESTSIQTGLN